MDALFWIGQVDWLAFLACGAYLSFCFWKLSDEENARKAELVEAGAPKLHTACRRPPLLHSHHPGRTAGPGARPDTHAAAQQTGSAGNVNIPHAAPATLR